MVKITVKNKKTGEEFRDVQVITVSQITGETTITTSAHLTKAFDTSKQVFKSEEIQIKIIQPFLAAKQNFTEEMDMKKIEDELIKAGKITERDRISFPKNKYLVCSSASYDFDYLFTIYKNYINNICHLII